MYFNSPVRIKPVFEHCSQEEKALLSKTEDSPAYGGRNPKDIKYARLIRRKAYTTEPGTNLHAMYVNLYIWCRARYRQRFMCRK